jgi:hypothetical protein
VDVSADPDAAFYLNAGPDPHPGNQTNADPDPGPSQTLKLNFYMKNILNVGNR